MAEGGKSNTVVWLLVVGALVWFLFIRKGSALARSTSASSYRPPAQSTGAAVVNAVAQNAGALGSFFGNLAKGFGGSSSGSSSSSDDLMTPSFGSSDFSSSSSFADDSYDYNDYA